MKKKNDFFGVLMILVFLLLWAFSGCNLPGDDLAAPSGDNTDLDGDGIPDDSDSDIDGDGISNTDEIQFGIDPYKEDTDGDGWADGVELGYFDRDSDPYRFNPKIADMPEIQVVFMDSPQLAVKYTTTEGKERSFTTEASTSFETSHSTSSSFAHSYASEYGWHVEATAGLEFEFGIDGGSSMSLAATVGGHGTYTSEDVYTWEESQSVSNQQGYSEAVATASSTSLTYEGGSIRLAVKIVNTGNLAISLENLSLAAYMIDPDSDGFGSLIGTLSANSSRVTIMPGESSGMMIFENNNLLVSDVFKVLSRSKGIVCEISGYSASLTSPGGTTDFTSEGTTVSAQTAKIRIDYGPGVKNSDGSPVLPEQYNVATRTKYNPDHSSMSDRYDPLTMADIMDSLYIPYQSGSFEQNSGLTSVRSIANDIPARKSWYILHAYSRDGRSFIRTYAIEKESYDFDSIVVHTGDTVQIIYSEDVDGDGLPCRLEQVLGIADTQIDSDSDTLGDYDEIMGWQLPNQTTVYTNPALADTDQDGLLDAEDPDPTQKTLSTDTAIDSVSLNGSVVSPGSTTTVDGDFVNIGITPSTPVLSVECNGTEFLHAEDQWVLEDYALSLGTQNLSILVTALDGVTTSTYSLEIVSNPEPVQNFAANTVNETSLILTWSGIEDSRVTQMIIIQRKDQPVDVIPQGTYVEGSMVGGGTVIASLTGNQLTTAVEMTPANLDAGANYHYKAINICENPDGDDVYSEESVSSAATATPPNKRLNFQLYHLEDMNDNDGTGGTRSEVYFEISYTFAGATMKLAYLNDSHVSLDDGSERFYSFYSQNTSRIEPLSPLSRDSFRLPHMEGLQLYLTVKIFEHDTGTYDWGTGDDDPYVEKNYFFNYDHTTQTWNAETGNPFAVGSVTEETYTGSKAGTVKLKMGVFMKTE